MPKWIPAARASDRQIEAIKSAGLEKLYFSWRGPIDSPDRQFYYRIHGLRILIEYADQAVITCIQ